jgi:hypothetical protein
MVFEGYGFETGRVLLPGLDLVVRLNEDKYFRNDGAVADVERHANGVWEELGISGHYCTSEVRHFGKHFPCTSGNDKASLIFIEDGDPITNRFYYGHESTHAVIHLGLESCFMIMLEKIGFALDPFKKYDNEESIADVGGIVSVYKTNQHKGLATHPTRPELSQIYEELMKSKKHS